MFRHPPATLKEVNMAVTVTTLISTCPAPVADATGVSNGLVWLALSAAFANDQMTTAQHDFQPIKSRAYTYFDLIKLSSTDYVDINNKLMHIKDMLSAINTLDS